MRRNIITTLAVGLCTMTIAACGNATGSQPTVNDEKTATEIPADSIIQLTEPDKSLEVTLMQALTDRQSQREFADRHLSLEDLSTLLWAANGINREDGKRTAPSAVNAQDIDLYVCLASGAYLYDAKQSRLVRITADDLRPMAAGRQPMSAPVFLIMVADLSRYPEGLAAQRPLVMQFAAEDAGYVSANIGLYSAAAGLATVPRATMDADGLRTSLRLTDQQVPLLNNPVGYKE